MKSTIIKTAVATIAVLVVLFGMALFVLTCFFPKTMRDFNATIGDDKNALRFAKIEYEKTAEVNDLKLILVYADSIDDNKTIIEYSKKYFDISNENADSSDLLDYVTGLFFDSITKENYSTVSILEFADTIFTTKYNGKFVKNNPYDVLTILSMGENSELSTSLKDKLQLIKGSLISHEEIELIDRDIDYLSK